MTLKEYLTAHEGEKGLPETLHTITPQHKMRVAKTLYFQGFCHS